MTTEIIFAPVEYIGRHFLEPTMPYDKHGANNPRWKGGRRVRSDGYVICYAPGHPYAYKDFVLEHRLVMENHIGRFLKPHELVHHKNENRSDNRLDNLEITNHSDHARHHNKGRDFTDRWQPKTDKETLVRLYVKEGMVLTEVAKEVGVSYGSVRFHLAYFGIPIRPGQVKARKPCQRLTRASQLFAIRENKNPGSSRRNVSTS